MIKDLLNELTAKAARAKTRVEVYNIVDSYIDKFMDSFQHCKQCWSIDAYWKSYCTWRVSLWLNRYTFGNRISLFYFSFDTHDEEKVKSHGFGVEDFRDQLEAYLQDYAIAIWNGDEEPELF